MNKYILVILLLVSLKPVLAENNTDQWNDAKITYKDLIEDGFEIKAYDTNTINLKDGLIILLFITVLQKEKEVYECQEYQTLDNSMKTLDMSLICRSLTQPYQRGVGT